MDQHRKGKGGKGQWDGSGSAGYGAKDILSCPPLAINLSFQSKEEVARQKSIWLCKCSLQILMGNEDHRRHPAAELGQDDDYQMDEMEDEEEEEEGMPPEVLFERNVFAGAEKVRLYYEVTVQRDNQLKQMAGGK